MLGRDAGGLLLVVPEPGRTHGCFELFLAGRQLNGVKGTHEPSRAGLRAPRAAAREVGSPGRPRVDGSCGGRCPDVRRKPGSPPVTGAYDVPHDRAAAQPGEADREAGDDVTDEVDVEQDAARPDRERERGRRDEPRRRPQPRARPLGEQQPERAVEDDRRRGVAARERVGVRQADRAAEVGPGPLVDRLQHGDEHRDPDHGEPHERRIGADVTPARGRSRPPP